MNSQTTVETKEEKGVFASDSQAQPKGGRWLTPEQFALPEFGNMDLNYVKRLLWPNCDKKHCPRRFHESDLKRYSQKRVMIYFMRPNGAGIDRPRLVDRD